MYIDEFRIYFGTPTHLPPEKIDFFYKLTQNILNWELSLQNSFTFLFREKKKIFFYKKKFDTQVEYSLPSETIETARKQAKKKVNSKGRLHLPRATIFAYRNQPIRWLTRC